MTTDAKLDNIDAAIAMLRIARDKLKLAGAPKATEKVRRAINSAEGARRHIELEPYREARQAKP